jgi:hypothetical protein
VSKYVTADGPQNNGHNNNKNTHQITAKRKTDNVDDDDTMGSRERSSSSDGIGNR